MELKRKIMHGVLWNSGASFGIQALNFLTKIIIARLLFPDDFGLFAMAFLLINFLSIFVGFGMMNAMIYKKEDYEKTKGTAFFLSIVTGLFFFGVSFISSSFIANFFHQPVVGIIIKVMSIVLLFDSISSILHGILLKDMEFKKKAIAEFISVVISSITVLFLALYGFGVWSLVWAYVLQHLSILIFSWIFIKEKPHVHLNKEIAKELFWFGKHIMSISIISWLVTSIDNIIVGKKLGDEPLGYYSMAFNLVTLPVSSFTQLIMTVFYPVYAKLEHEAALLKKAYLKPLEWSLIVMLPIAVFLFFIPEKIIAVIFGQKWLGMVTILRIFSLYCVFRTICTIISHVLTGVGKPRIAALLLGIEFSIILLFIFPAVTYFRLEGIAFVIVFARGVSAFLHLIAVQKVVQITMPEYYSLFVRKATAVGAMCIIVFGLSKILLENSFLNMGIIVLLGISSYFFVLFMLERKMFLELFTLLKEGRS